MLDHLEVNNLGRKMSGYNTTILPKRDKGKISCIPDKNKNQPVMQVPAGPEMAWFFVGLKAAGLLFGNSVVYVLSISKAISISLATICAIRPGVPFRAFLEVERTFARIFRYRELTLISDEKVVSAIYMYLQKFVLNFLSSPAGLSFLVATGSFVVLSGLKSWIQFLFGKEDLRIIKPGEDKQLFLPMDLDGGAAQREEIRVLKIQLQQTKRRLRRELLE